MDNRLSVLSIPVLGSSCLVEGYIFYLPFPVHPLCLHPETGYDKRSPIGGWVTFLGQMMMQQKCLPNPQTLSRGGRALTSRGRQNRSSARSTPARSILIAGWHCRVRNSCCIHHPVLGPIHSGSQHHFHECGLLFINAFQLLAAN